ncbi:Helitron helicase [Phytophthora megakarya]|uniref:Helitron helicase n=1 Tax=Phytophthora megakarya TaxID=4795 RepID=A0A225W2V9_9STRA|nr:Helitron helicase [Phytophthora megakarya]
MPTMKTVIPQLSAGRRRCNAPNVAPRKSKKCGYIAGKAKPPPSCEAPQQLRLLFSNPVFMKSIRAYNNVSAFTSIGATLSVLLRVNKSVMRREIYNFRVMGACGPCGKLHQNKGWIELRNITTLSPNSSYTHAIFSLISVDQPWKQLEQIRHDTKKKNTREMNKNLKRMVTNTRIENQKKSEAKKK